MTFASQPAVTAAPPSAADSDSDDGDEAEGPRVAAAEPAPAPQPPAPPAAEGREAKLQQLSERVRQLGGSVLQYERSAGMQLEPPPRPAHSFSGYTEAVLGLVTRLTGHLEQGQARWQAVEAELAALRAEAARATSAAEAAHAALHREGEERLGVVRRLEQLEAQAAGTSLSLSPSPSPLRAAVVERHVLRPQPPRRAERISPAVQGSLDAASDALRLLDASPDPLLPRGGGPPVAPRPLGHGLDAALAAAAASTGLSMAVRPPSVSRPATPSQPPPAGAADSSTHPPCRRSPRGRGRGCLWGQDAAMISFVK